MWIINEDGEAINLSRATEIYSDNRFYDKNFYSVVASFSLISHNHKTIPIAKFATKDEAKKYIAELVEKLNEEQEFYVFRQPPDIKS